RLHAVADEDYGLRVAVQMEEVLGVFQLIAPYSQPLRLKKPVHLPAFPSINHQPSTGTSTTCREATDSRIAWPTTRLSQPSCRLGWGSRSCRMHCAKWRSWLP